MTKFNNVNVKRVTSNLKAGKKEGARRMRVVELRDASRELRVPSCELRLTEN